jgi:hypothetical protein
VMNVPEIELLKLLILFELRDIIALYLFDR